MHGEGGERDGSQGDGPGSQPCTPPLGWKCRTFSPPWEASGFLSSSRLPARPWELRGPETPSEQTSPLPAVLDGSEEQRYASVAALGTIRRRPGILPKGGQSHWVTLAPRAEVSPTAASVLEASPSNSLNTSLPSQQGSLRCSRDIRGLTSCWRRRICKLVTQMKSDWGCGRRGQLVPQPGSVSY